MKDLFLIAILLVAVGATAATGVIKGSHSSPQRINLQFNTKDIPGSGLNIVTPADPDFDGTVKARLGAKMAVIEPLLPFTVLLRNSGDRTVIAYSLKWELMRNDGQTLTQNRSYTTLWKLMGVEGADRDGNIIRPNSFALAAPANLDLNHFADNEVNNDPKLQEYVTNIRSELAAFSGMTVTLDGVFFDDGTFVGPDTTDYFLKVKKLRDARRDLYLELQLALKQGKPSNQALQRVEDVASEPDVRLTSSATPDDYYKKYKKEAASELLRIRKSSGDDKAVERAVELLKNSWLDLKKR